jgi:hypothetical protein
VVAIPEGGAIAVRDGLTSATTSTEIGEIEARSQPQGVACGAAHRILVGEGAGLDGEKERVAPSPICRVLSRWG